MLISKELKYEQKKGASFLAVNWSQSSSFASWTYQFMVTSISVWMQNYSHAWLTITNVHYIPHKISFELIRLKEWLCIFDNYFHVYDDIYCSWIGYFDEFNGCWLSNITEIVLGIRISLINIKERAFSNFIDKMQVDDNMKTYN